MVNQTFRLRRPCRTCSDTVPGKPLAYQHALWKFESFKTVIAPVRMATRTVYRAFLLPEMEMIMGNQCVVDGHWQSTLAYALKLHARRLELNLSGKNPEASIEKRKKLHDSPATTLLKQRSFVMMALTFQPQKAFQIGLVRFSADDSEVWVHELLLKSIHHHESFLGGI